MVLSGVLGYLAGTATKMADTVVKSVSKKISDKATKSVTGGGKKPAPMLDIKKAAGDITPTGKDISPRAQQRSRGDVTGNYEPAETYGDKPAPAYAGTTYAALLAPLIIGTAWLAYIFIAGKSNIPAGQLSPAGMSKQVLLLSIFIIVYLIFLILVFIGKREQAKKTGKNTKKKK